MAVMTESTAAADVDKLNNVEEDKEMVFEEVKASPGNNTSLISDTFSIQIDQNYINGVSPVLDIVNEEDDIGKARHEINDSTELMFDDLKASATTTVIGQSEINKLSQAETNGVMTIP